MNGLDLFSGIGGNTLALSEWVNTVAYCEADKHAQAVLLSRMQAGDIRPAPICADITTLSPKHIDIPIDIIIAGFPCQDISVAGDGAGLEGKRSGLFFDVCRMVEEIKPRFVFLENVPAIRTRGLRTVVRELTNLGYDCRWTRVSAASVGAPHRRERWFLLAHSLSEQLRHKQGRCRRQGGKGETEFGNHDKKESLAYTLREGPQRCRVPSGRQKENSHSSLESWWEIEPDVGRVADGVAFRVDRIKAIGNGQVPAVVRKAWKLLSGQQVNSRPT